MAGITFLLELCQVHSERCKALKLVIKPDRIEGMTKNNYSYCMNSVLQCLLAIPDLTDYYINCKFEKYR